MGSSSLPAYCGSQGTCRGNLMNLSTKDPISSQAQPFLSPVITFRPLQSPSWVQHWCSLGRDSDSSHLQFCDLPFPLMDSYSFSMGAITNCHKLVAYNNTHALSCSSPGQKSGMVAGLCSFLEALEKNPFPSIQSE